jgi:antitoxin (DNA-binding transcriptional repressor) of toxin-antitoxin stability system
METMSITQFKQELPRIRKDIKSGKDVEITVLKGKKKKVVGVFTNNR